MCYYDLYKWSCNDWKWGLKRRHCQPPHRLGETCSKHFVHQTIPLEGLCRFHEAIKEKERQLEEVMAVLQDSKSDPAATKEALKDFEGISKEFQKLRNEYFALRTVLEELGCSIVGDDPAILGRRANAAGTMRVKEDIAEVKREDLDSYSTLTDDQRPLLYHRANGKHVARKLDEEAKRQIKGMDTMSSPTVEQQTNTNDIEVETVDYSSADMTPKRLTVRLRFSRLNTVA